MKEEEKFFVYHQEPESKFFDRPKKPSFLAGLVTGLVFATFYILIWIWIAL